jgi:hypothetical protein
MMVKESVMSAFPECSRWIGILMPILNKNILPKKWKIITRMVFQNPD